MERERVFSGIKITETISGTSETASSSVLPKCQLSRFLGTESTRKIGVRKKEKTKKHETETKAKRNTYKYLKSDTTDKKSAVQTPRFN